MSVALMPVNPCPHSLVCHAALFSAGFVIAHDRFLSLFRRYLQSHFVPAFEILLLLIVSCLRLYITAFTLLRRNQVT